MSKVTFTDIQKQENPRTIDLPATSVDRVDTTVVPTMSIAVETPKAVVPIQPAPVLSTQVRMPLPSEEIVSTALALPTQEIQGSFRNSDINLPVIQIVQGVGPLKVKFPQQEGYFVLNKELLLTPPTIPLQLVVTRYRKQVIENLPYDNDNVGQARVVESEEQALALGGTLEWDEEVDPVTHKSKKIPPTWVPIGTAFCVVLAPKGLEEDVASFPYEFEGRRHAIAIWRLRSTAYTTVARTVMTASRQSLKPENGGLAKGLWFATTKYEKRGMNFVHVPYIVRADKKASGVDPVNSDSFAAFCREITTV